MEERKYEKKLGDRHGTRFLAFVILFSLKRILRHRYYFNSTDKNARSEKSYNLPTGTELISSRSWIQTQVSREYNPLPVPSHHMGPTVPWTPLSGWTVVDMWYSQSHINHCHVCDYGLNNDNLLNNKIAFISLSFLSYFYTSLTVFLGIASQMNCFHSHGVFMVGFWGHQN